MMTAGRPDTWCRRCHKDAYPTKDEAIARALVRIASGSRPLHAYPCPAGGKRGWHLTSDLTPPARRRRERNRS